MGIATERWSDKKVTQTIDGNWVYTRGWDVISFVDEVDAISSTGVSPGSAHPIQSQLTCTTIAVVENKFSYARVQATYSLSTILANNVDPITRAPFVSWKWGKQSQPVDTDQFGNPILNSAGDAFKGKVTRNFSVRYLTLTRYELYYDQSQATYFTDTTNDSAIGFEGNNFDAGQVYCISYAPVETYQEGAPYIKTAYEFEIRTPNTPNLTDLQKRYPFQPRILDQGTRAVYNDPNNGDSLGHLVLGDGREVKSDVLLDGTGLPVDDTIKVTLGALDPVAQTLPDGVLTDSTDTATFLIYLIYPEVDFVGLGGS